MDAIEMERDPPNIEAVAALEKSLLKPEIRASPEKVERLLADEFIEFGSSGRIYNKSDIIHSLQNERDGHISVNDLRLKALGSGVVLVTYRASRHSADKVEEKKSLRSSIWKFEDDRWQMIFHQGTNTEA